MHFLAQYLFTTVEGLLILTLFVGTPVVLTLMSAKSIRPLHVAINGFLATLFGIPAGWALPQVKEGDGMGGLVILLTGAGAGLLALAFVAATLSAGFILFLKRNGVVQRLPKRQPRRRALPSAQPLTNQYERWKVTSRRPTATYQDFLEEAHPRYFPSSALALAAAAAVMLVVWYLILR